MAYFLAKTEPDSYSIDQLERDGKTIWDGVKNAQAVRAIKEMKPGDHVFIYHSGGVSAIVGLAKVIGEPKPDPKEPKSWTVELQFLKKLDPPTTLAEIKKSGKFDDCASVRQSRLSTMSVPQPFVDWLK